MINRIKPIATCTIFGFVVTILASPYEVEYAIAQSAPQENEISIPALQARVSQQGKSPEDVNRAMRDRFPNSNFPYYEPPNGCSLPWYLPNADWNRIFERACNNHDNCYATPGNTQLDCDDQMLLDMNTICENLTNPMRTACIPEAGIYYGGIRTFGEDPYITAREQQTEYIKVVYDWLNTQKYLGVLPI